MFRAFSVALASAMLVLPCAAPAKAPMPTSLAAEHIPIYPVVWVFYPYIKQVICDSGFGTAVRIGPNRFLSVNHVTKHSGCTIDDEPITVESASFALDFSIVTTATPGRNSARYSCAGIQKGEWVYAIGHGRGWPRQTIVSLFSRGELHDNGMTVLHGSTTVVPGHSGGAVINGAGEIVAVVNAYNPFFRWSIVREIKDTSLCKEAYIA